MNTILALLFLLRLCISTDVEAKAKAADEDIGFVLYFFQDFEEQMPEYTSYMMQNHITFPQHVADYYYHLVGLPSTADLQPDVISYFPFTQFHTFVTAFPWYSSILSKANMTRFYLPEDFITPTASQTTMIPNNGSSSALTTRSKNHGSTLFVPLGGLCILVNLLII